MVSTKYPTFIPIITTAYSGATLLSFLLGSHPEIATVGEMSGLISEVDPDEYLCSCGQKIKNCQFWQSVKTGMANRGFELNMSHFETRFKLNPRFVQGLRQRPFLNSTLESIRNKIIFNLPSETRQFKALVDRNEAFVESILEVTSKNVFLDSSKGSLRAKAFHQFSSFDVRAIHLIRDVRGVVASRLRYATSTSAARAARNWAKLHQGMETMLKSWPKEKYMQVRYEDLCQNTETILKQLYEFCGVNPNFKLEDLQAVPHHIVGNKMRLRPISEIKLDERWKRELTTEQLKAIDQVTGVLSRQYGYN